MDSFTYEPHYVIAAPYENDQDYVNKWIHIIDTILTVQATLELCLYRAAKIS
jgi:hypothetical protein